MKKLRLFLTGMLAAVVAVGGVNADETVQTFEQCVNNSNKEVCELSADHTLTSHLIISRNLQINLNGHKLSAENSTGAIVVKNGARVTIDGGNGTIDYSKFTLNATRIYVYEKSTLDIDNITINAVEATADDKNPGVFGVDAGVNSPVATLNIGEKAVITATDSIVGIDTPDYSSKVGGNAKVTIAGKLTSDGNAVTINGHVKECSTPVNVIVEGTAEITSNKAAGVYAAGYGLWTFEDGAKVTGYDAISIKSGVVTINGGEYNANGALKLEPTPNNSGAELTGSVISITSRNGYAGNVKVVINDGKFVAEKGLDLLETTNEDTSSLVDLKIKGGEFICGITAGEPVLLRKSSLLNFVEGGTFTGNHSGFRLESKYVKGETEVVDGVTYVGADKEALHNVKVALVQPDGQTVNVAGAYRVAAGNKISLTKLFGFDITKYADYTVTYVVKNAEGTELARLSASYLKGADGKYAAAYDDEFTMTAADVNVEIIFSKNGKVVAPVEPVIPDNEITTEIPSADDVVTTDEETSKVLTETLKNTEDKDLQELLEKDDVTIELKAEETKVEEDQEKKFADALPNATISKYLEISVLVKSGTKTLNLHELDEEIVLTVKIPENLPEVAEGYTRVYYILREHDGKVETLKTVLSEDGTELSFATDKFSTYALAYEDQANAETTPENPDTLDTISSYLMISAIACTGLVALGYSIKKKLEN